MKPEPFINIGRQLATPAAANLATLRQSTAGERLAALLKATAHQWGVEKRALQKIARQQQQQFRRTVPPSIGTYVRSVAFTPHLRTCLRCKGRYRFASRIAKSSRLFAKKVNTMLAELYRRNNMFEDDEDRKARGRRSRTSRKNSTISRKDSTTSKKNSAISRKDSTTLTKDSTPSRKSKYGSSGGSRNSTGVDDNDDWETDSEYSYYSSSSGERISLYENLLKEDMTDSEDESGSSKTVKIHTHSKKPDKHHSTGHEAHLKSNQGNRYVSQERMQTKSTEDAVETQNIRTVTNKLEAPDEIDSSREKKATRSTISSRDEGKPIKNVRIAKEANEIIEKGVVNNKSVKKVNNKTQIKTRKTNTAEKQRSENVSEDRGKSRRKNKFTRKQHHENPNELSVLMEEKREHVTDPKYESKTIERKSQQSKNDKTENARQKKELRKNTSKNHKESPERDRSEGEKAMQKSKIKQQIQKRNATKRKVGSQSMLTSDKNTDNNIEDYDIGRQGEQDGSDQRGACDINRAKCSSLCIHMRDSQTQIHSEHQYSHRRRHSRDERHTIMQPMRTTSATNRWRRESLSPNTFTQQSIRRSASQTLALQKARERIASGQWDRLKDPNYRWASDLYHKCHVFCDDLEMKKRLSHRKIWHRRFTSPTHIGLTPYHKNPVTPKSWTTLMKKLRNSSKSPKVKRDRVVRKVHHGIVEPVPGVSESPVKSVVDPRDEDDTAVPHAWQNRCTLLAYEIDRLRYSYEFHQHIWDTLTCRRHELLQLHTLQEQRNYDKVQQAMAALAPTGSVYRIILPDTRLPGNICTGLSILQACKALLIGRNWHLRALKKKLHRINKETHRLDAVVDELTHYKQVQLIEQNSTITKIDRQIDRTSEELAQKSRLIEERVASLHVHVETEFERSTSSVVRSAIDDAIAVRGSWFSAGLTQRCLLLANQRILCENDTLCRSIEQYSDARKQMATLKRSWHKWLLQGNVDV